MKMKRRRHRRAAWITIWTLVFLFVILTGHWFLTLMTTTAFTHFIDDGSDFTMTWVLTIVSPIMSILLYEVYRFIAIDTDDD